MEEKQLIDKALKQYQSYLQIRLATLKKERQQLIANNKLITRHNYWIREKENLLQQVTQLIAKRN